jgi:hypothetical protein
MQRIHRKFISIADRLLTRTYHLSPQRVITLLCLLLMCVRAPSQQTPYDFGFRLERQAPVNSQMALLARFTPGTNAA